MRSALYLLATLAVLAAPASAWATAGERECSLAAGAGTAAPAGAATSAVVAVDGQWLHHASDFWAFGGALRARALTAGEVGAAATVDARWTLDALTWIPSLAVGVGPQLASWQSSAVGLVARAEASLAYRNARDHGWVVRVAFDGTPLQAPLAGIWTVSVGYVNYHGHGIGIDL